MSKSVFRCLLPLFLLSSVVTVASAAVPTGTLLSVSSTPAAILQESQPETHTATCYIKPFSVVITHTRMLYLSGIIPIQSTETKNVAVSVATLKSLINRAAMGPMMNNIAIVGASSYRYSAYQQQANGKLKETILDDTPSHITNGAAEVLPLKHFIDSVCGDISK